MAEHDDPIIISDDEEQQRRPRRRTADYSVWYGQRRNRRGGVARAPHATARERSLLAYILAVSQLIAPNHPMTASNNANYLEGRYDQILVPSVVALARGLERLRQRVNPVQMT
jgi:hypothetical protein